jgi:hypothetical protein
MIYPLRKFLGQDKAAGRRSYVDHPPQAKFKAEAPFATDQSAFDPPSGVDSFT